MAYIDIDIDAEDWFNSASDHERKEMHLICKEYFEIEETSIDEQEFIDILKNIKERYLSLTTEQINQLKNI
jgi:uncharacterized tellurite resistance protein B-like protein